MQTIADDQMSEEQKAYDKISLAFAENSDDEAEAAPTRPLTEEQRAEKKHEFEWVGRAFRTLINPERRALYDKSGDAGVATWTPPKTRVQSSDMAWWGGLIIVALLTWYPVFVMNIGEANKRPKKKKREQGDNALDEWVARLLKLNWVQQVYISFFFFIIASMIIGSGPELNKYQKSYFKNLDEVHFMNTAHLLCKRPPPFPRHTFLSPQLSPSLFLPPFFPKGIMYLEREPVNYGKAIEAFDAAMDLEFGRRHVLPWLLSGHAYMELGDR
jgi:hypothetical protein